MMEYKFIYKNTPWEFWQLSIYFMYGSIVGVCNIIFTAAMIILATTIWDNISSSVRMLLVIACCLFPIVQPIGIYVRAKKQAAVSKIIEIGFNDTGIHVKTDDKSSDIKWRNIKKIAKKPNIIVIFSTTTRGFILSNRVLGKQKEEFYNYIVSKMNR